MSALRGPGPRPGQPPQAEGRPDAAGRRRAEAGAAPVEARRRPRTKGCDGSRPGAGRVRLDQLLVERGLAPSRTDAARLVLAGRVSVEGAPAPKAGHLYRGDVAVAVTAVSPYVGRGGEKLAAALDAFSVDPGGRVCLDVGASTGGFTDCLLTRGARRVYAVDVGHGQLHPRLRSDPRVVVREGVNARALEAAWFDPRPDLATVDVSFISLEKVLPAVAACLASGAPADLVVLAKPQFEVGRGRVGKGGVVRDAARHAEVLRHLAAFAVGAGLAPRAVAASPLRGAKGNREFFLHLRTAGEPLTPAQVAAAIEAAVGGTPRAAANDGAAG